QIFGGPLLERSRSLRLLGSRWQADGHIRGTEGVDVVLGRGSGIGFMDLAVDQVQTQGIGSVARGNRLFGDGDFGRAGSADISQKDVLPRYYSRRSAYILNIEHVILEVIVEDPRLNLKQELRRSDVLFQAG